MNAQDRELIESKFEGSTKLMNAHFINMDDKLELIMKKQDFTNGRVNKLEDKVNEREIFCIKEQAVKIEYSKYRNWKIALIILASSVLASLITHSGLLEFLNFIK